MILTGAQIIMECLLEQGVDTVFGYPGGAVLNIYDALYEYRDRITHYRTAHEQGAAHAADGYARSSGKVGVCIATSGPGATNLVTGIATAHMDSVPLVAITGNVATNLLGLDSFQEVDITGITMPITKYNCIVREVTQLAQAIRDAFRIAKEGRPGPVLVDIPKDITAAKCEFTPSASVQPEKPCAEPPLDEALCMLERSDRPLIYAGGGVQIAEASEALAAFAEQLDAPVSCSLMCQGGFDQQNSRYIGMLGMHGTMTSSLAIQSCDLLVAVGTRFSDRVTCNTELFARGCPVLHIDIDPAEFHKNIPARLTLGGDAGQILAALTARLTKRRHPDWMGRITAWQKKYPLQQPLTEGSDLTPQMILETLDRLTNSDAILTTEVGQHQMWAAQFYRFRRPRQLVTSGGLGTMGFGLGAAIGAQVANPDRRVINVAGDGSFHMNANELSTLAAYQIPVIELLFHNRVLGMVRQWQKLFYGGRFSQTNLNQTTNYELLAAGYGVKALRITHAAEIEPVLKQALSLHEPLLIHCLIGQDQNVLPMVPAGASVEEPILTMDC